MPTRVIRDYEPNWGQDAMRLPCGGVAYFDESSGHSYRCEVCGAVVGSIGQPQRCKDAAQKYHNWAKLGGEDWDYFKELDEYEDSKR